MHSLVCNSFKANMEGHRKEAEMYSNFWTLSFPREQEIERRQYYYLLAFLGFYLCYNQHQIFFIWKLYVFCYQNCSDLLWEKNVPVIEKKFEIRGWRPRIFKIEITRTIYSNSERSQQFLVTECFFNFLMSHKLEKL